MSWLSSEEVKMSHFKLTMGMFVMFFIGFIFGAFEQKVRNQRLPTTQRDATQRTNDTTIRIDYHLK